MPNLGSNPPCQASLLIPAELLWIDDYNRRVAAQIGLLLEDTGRPGCTAAPPFQPETATAGTAYRIY